MSQNTDPWIGRQVGRYTLRQRLGSGGSGAVYAAWDEVLEREVALKLLLMLPGATTEMIKRFQQEAKLTARLNHPNIVPIYDIGEDGKRPVNGSYRIFDEDPHWRDLVLFYEYFHGDGGMGLGASHQTGWTALVAKLLQQSGDFKK